MKKLIVLALLLVGTTINAQKKPIDVKKNDFRIGFK